MDGSSRCSASQSVVTRIWSRSAMGTLLENGTGARGAGRLGGRGRPPRHGRYGSGALRRGCAATLETRRTPGGGVAGAQAHRRAGTGRQGGRAPAGAHGRRPGGRRCDHVDVQAASRRLRGQQVRPSPARVASDQEAIARNCSRRTAMTFTPAPDDVLIVVDVQRDFCPGGSLAVPDGDQVVPVVNRLAPRFATVVTTHDTHPADHSSFVAQGGPWPPHCVEVTPGWETHPDLRVEPDFQVFKGCERELDGYTGWTPELADFLVKRGVCRVVVSGLALDYCVKAAARAAGYDAVLRTAAFTAVNAAPDDDARAPAALRATVVREDTAEAAARPA